ncbi:hypothetical protein ACQKD6_24380 [Bacillus cereus]|uniref:hypothetical protein n=1 Tax=Bacillus cereus TaxID=1396 RepID=UPI003CFD28C7
MEMNTNNRIVAIISEINVLNVKSLRPNKTVPIQVAISKSDFLSIEILKSLIVDRSFSFHADQNGIENKNSNVKVNERNITYRAIRISVDGSISIISATFIFIFDKDTRIS